MTRSSHLNCTPLQNNPASNGYCWQYDLSTRTNCRVAHKFALTYVWFTLCEFEYFSAVIWAFVLEIHITTKCKRWTRLRRPLGIYRLRQLQVGGGSRRNSSISYLEIQIQTLLITIHLLFADSRRIKNDDNPAICCFEQIKCAEEKAARWEIGNVERNLFQRHNWIVWSIWSDPTTWELLIRADSQNLARDLSIAAVD